MDMRIASTSSILNIYNYGRLDNNIRMSRAEESVDSVKLSDEAKDYNLALKTINNAPDIRESKVDEIMKKMESGYNVSAFDIADKIVEDYFRGR